MRVRLVSRHDSNVLLKLGPGSRVCYRKIDHTVSFVDLYAEDGGRYDGNFSNGGMMDDRISCCELSHVLNLVSALSGLAVRQSDVSETYLYYELYEGDE